MNKKKDKYVEEKICGLLLEEYSLLIAKSSVAELSKEEKELLSGIVEIQKDMQAFRKYTKILNSINNDLSKIKERLTDIEDYLMVKKQISIDKNRIRYKLTKPKKRAILQRDNFTCQNCGISKAKNKKVILHVDHIIPVSKGGTNETSNLQTLCNECNMKKLDEIP